MVGNFWGDIEKMHEEMDNLFNRLYRGRLPYQGVKDYQDDFRVPMAEARWSEDSLLMQLELPGVDKNDVKLNIGDGKLEVKVDKKDETEKEDGDSREFRCIRQQFYRQIPLPEDLDLENVHADLKNGLLSIKFPKKELEHRKPKQIEIK